MCLASENYVIEDGKEDIKDTYWWKFKISTQDTR